MKESVAAVHNATMVASRMAILEFKFKVPLASSCI
jgi:hypothetical protein